jgi:hypothetical protein
MLPDFIEEFGMNKENEIWKDIKGYEGYYQISNYGKVKSLKRGRKKKTIFKKPTIKQNGYYILALYKNNNQKIFYLHRLIGIMFIPNPENKKWMNHKDGNKLNNSIANLEWCSPSENNYHAIRNKLRQYKLGEDRPQSKLKRKDVLEIRKLYSKISQLQLAKLYSVSTKTIQSIILRKTWRHI